MTPFQQQAELQALLVEALEVLIPSEVRSVPEATQYLDQIASRMRALAEPEHQRQVTCLVWVNRDNPRKGMCVAHDDVNPGEHNPAFEGDYVAVEMAGELPEPEASMLHERDRERLESVRAYTKENGRLTKERDAARAEVDELRKDRDGWIAECQSHVREKSELATQLEQARRDVQTKNDSFQCAVAAKDKALAEIAKLKAQCNNLGLKLVASDSEVERLKLAYISASAESDEAVACAQATVRNEVERLKQALHSANTDLERLRAERSHLDRIRELESKVESLLDERAVHIDTIDDLTEERNRLSGRLRTTEEERSHAVILGRQADDYARYARGEVERLKQELSAARDALPAWVVPFTSDSASRAKFCNIADCKTDLCTSWRNLSDDQRRQCLGKT